MATLDPKKLFFDDQDIASLDVREVYNNFIKDIDTYRSHFNVMNGPLQDTLKKETIDSIISNTDITTGDYQESRCHTFYRMVGFPVVSSSGELYSPGYSRTVNLSSDKLNNHIKIANNLDPDVKDASRDRELRQAQISGIFAKQDINATALTVATQFIRNLDYLDVNKSISISNQSYIIEQRDNVNKILVDDSGNSPTVSYKNTKGKFALNQHILRPFIVDPRIDFTVIPAKNIICAPFLEDKSKTMLRPDVYLARPYIEKVLSLRCNISNKNTSTGDYVDNLISLINQDNVDAVLANNLDMLKNSNSKIELIIFAKLIKILRATTTRLYQATIKIREISTGIDGINWFPIPNVRGPEFGSKLRDITSAEDKNDKKIEKEIRDSLRKKIIDEINFDVGLGDATVGNFAFSGTNDIIFGQFSNVSKLYDQQIKKLKNNREQLGKEANTAISDIEIITGEVSGLGLIDIITINSALWIMDKAALLSLIDDDAFTRMYARPELQSEEVKARKTSGPAMDGNAALAEFELRISEISSLAQKFYDGNKSNIF